MVGTEYNVDCYRYTQITDDTNPWGPQGGSPVRTYMFSFYATIQPFTADDGIHNDQLMMNVRYRMGVDNQPELAVRFDDELVFWDTVQRIANIQRHRSDLLPHCEIFLADTQKNG